MITLRAIEPEDAEMMYKAETDEAAWKYSDYLAPLSKDMLRVYATTYDADPYRSGQLRLMIESNGIPVGLADLFDISPRHLRAETGIYILPEFRNNGMAEEALNRLKEYASKRLGLHQLTATISESNGAAFNAFQKAGFKRTGSRPDWLRTPVGYETAHIFNTTL